MRNLHKYLRITAIILASLVLTGIGVAVNVRAAGSPIVYLSPSGTTVNVNQSFSLNIYEDSGSANVDTVNVSVAYDSSTLTYTGYSLSGSKFSLFNGTYSASSGHVSFVSNILGGSTTGNQYVGVLNFQAKAGSGSSSLSMAGSDLAYAGNSLGASNAGATISFTTPAPPPPSNPPSSGGGGTPVTKQPVTGSSSTTTKNSTPSTPTSQPPASKQPTSNTNSPVTVNAAAPQYTDVQLGVSGQPSYVYISYSTDQQHFTNTEQTPLATAHSILLQNLIPGTTYYYRVVSKSSSGTVTTGPLESFTTKGLVIAVTVYDKSHHPLKNQTIVLHSLAQSAKTNNDGVAQFPNVAPGEHHIIYAKGGKNYSQPLTVQNNVQSVNGVQSAPIQNLAVVLPVGQGGISWLTWVVIVVALLVVLFVLYVFKGKLRGRIPSGQVLPLEGVIIGGAGVPPYTTQNNIPGTTSFPQQPQSIQPTGAITPERKDDSLDGQNGDSNGFNPS